MRRRPLVTIAIPTLERRELLATAVRSALAQTHRDIEVVVSDNVSTDGTAELLASWDDPRLRVLTQARRLSMMENWNACLEAATGEFFILLSDDDYLEPTAIERMLESFTRPDEGERIGMVWCRAAVVDAEGRVISTPPPAPSRERSGDMVVEFFRARRSTFPCCILLRTADVRAVGGYRGDRFPLIADAQVWMSVALGYPWVAHVDEPLSNYRTHASSTTTQVRVEDWLRNNRDLAQLCIDRFSATGDVERGRRVEREIRRFNAGVVAGLLVTPGLPLRSTPRALLSLAAMWRHYADPVSFAHVAWRVFRSLVGHPIKRALRGGAAR
jgi:glycosyltransferase involved in cell wall biosynthesis